MSMFERWSGKPYHSEDIRERMEKVGHDLRSIERRIRSMEQERMIEEIATRVAAKLKENGVRDGDA